MNLFRKLFWRFFPPKPVVPGIYYTPEMVRALKANTSAFDPNSAFMQMRPLPFSKDEDNAEIVIFNYQKVGTDVQ